MPAVLRIPMIRDITQALMVLALVFLNFAHAPAASAYDGELDAYLLPAGIDASICGDDGSEEKSHPPCHACRIGGAADIPSPVGAVMAVGVPTTVVYTVFPENQLATQLSFLPPATGPPSA